MELENGSVVLGYTSSNRPAQVNYAVTLLFAIDGVWTLLSSWPSGKKSPLCGLLLPRDQEVSSPLTLLITTIWPGGGLCKWLWAPCWQRQDLRVRRKHPWKHWQRCCRVVSTEKYCAFFLVCGAASETLILDTAPLFLEGSGLPSDRRKNCPL